MSAVKTQLVNLIDCLPEQEQLLIYEIVKRFIPDDVATPADLAAIAKANAEFERGEYVRHEDIDWDAPPAQA